MIARAIDFHRGFHQMSKNLGPFCTKLKIMLIGKTVPFWNVVLLSRNSRSGDCWSSAFAVLTRLAVRTQMAKHVRVSSEMLSFIRNFMLSLRGLMDLRDSANSFAEMHPKKVVNLGRKVTTRRVAGRIRIGQHYRP
jgi:hypothetical protein